jgi:hypothetical protein
MSSEAKPTKPFCFTINHQHINSASQHPWLLLFDSLRGQRGTGGEGFSMPCLAA